MKKLEPIKTIKEELARLLVEVERDYLNWYTKNCKRSSVYWHSLQVLAILPGFITGVLAAMNTTNSEFIKQWIIWLPIGGSFAGTLLTQFKIYDVWKIREDGRVAFEALVNEARVRMSMASTDQEYFDIYGSIHQKMNDVETDALRKFFALSSSEFIAKFQKVNP